MITEKELILALLLLQQQSKGDWFWKSTVVIKDCGGKRYRVVAIYG